MSLSTFGEKLELRSEVEILAEPRLVWIALLDFPAHQRWNPFWNYVAGRAEPGAHVTLDLTMPGGKTLKLERRIETLDIDHELRWTGKYGWGWLLRSEQYFRLDALENGRTRLVVGENLRGPGVTSNDGAAINIARGQALMNQAFKRHVESLPQKTSGDP